MGKLLDELQAFNSKERFFLIGQILGNPTFTPSITIREQLSAVLQVQIPEAVFSAMDYHLDWLYASLQIAASNDAVTVFSNHGGMIKAQQEDVDFLIAFDADDGCHVILIEAKGVTGWTNEQMTSKANRLRGIFGDDGTKWRGVVPHFVLMSSNLPQKLIISHWPPWMAPGGKLAWIRLAVPEGLKSVSRSNAIGQEDRQGKYWTIIPR